MFIFSRSKWLAFISPLHLFTRPVAPSLPVPAAGSCLASPGLGDAPGVHGGGTAGSWCAGGAGVLPPTGLMGTGAGARGLPVPVGRYPWVGNHDGLQVEAPVTQIPAERGGRATAHGKQQHLSMCLPVSQATLCRDAGNPRGSRHSQVFPSPCSPPARWGGRGRACSGQGGMPTPAWGGRELLHLNGWF